MRRVNQIRANNGKIPNPILFGAGVDHPGSFFLLQVGHPGKLLDGHLDAIITIVGLRRAAGGGQQAQHEQVRQDNSLEWKARHRVLSI
jgi:hypothetical protein